MRPQVPLRTHSPKNPWPYAIATFFGIFIAFLAGFITWAVQQNMDLVHKDYYNDEILFQKQIDTEARTRAVASDVSVRYDPGQRLIKVQVPVEQVRLGTTGHIHLYRPSDARLDREIRWAPGPDGAQSIDAVGLRSGLWRARLQWQVFGCDFYFQQSLVIGD